MKPDYLAPALVAHVDRLARSLKYFAGRELFPDLVGEALARAVAEAPFVVVSHGKEDDPILNYGNQMALDLWEMTWDRLVQTPSRLTAEPVNRADREWMLEQARRRGYIDTYRGVRISATGRRFLVEDALIWNVMDPQGRGVGQAASFSHWTWLT